MPCTCVLGKICSKLFCNSWVKGKKTPFGRGFCAAVALQTGDAKLMESLVVLFRAEYGVWGEGMWRWGNVLCLLKLTFDGLIAKYSTKGVELMLMQ